MQTLEQQFTIQFTFPVIFDRDIFRPDNRQLASVLLRGGKKCHKVLCFIDSGVLQAHPFAPGAAWQAMPRRTVS